MQTPPSTMTRTGERFPAFSCRGVFAPGCVCSAFCALFCAGFSVMLSFSYDGMIRIRFAGEGAHIARSQPDRSGSPKSICIVSRFL